MRKCNIESLRKWFVPFVLFTSGLVVGSILSVICLHAGKASSIHTDIDTGRSFAEEFAETLGDDPVDQEIRSFIRQMDEPRIIQRISPLIVEYYDDQKRFSVLLESKSYVIASELYSYPSGRESEIVRTYAFKEGGNDILFVIARDSHTNKLKNIQYSYGNHIVYTDDNGDGIWDTIKGVPAYSPDPIVGPLADGTNGIIYSIRGDYDNAITSAIGVVPVIGGTAKATKGVIKGSNTIKAGVEVISSGGNLVKMSKIQLKNFDEHAFKLEYLNPKDISLYNMSVDKTTKEIVLTPVKKGTATNIHTGVYLDN